MNIETGQAKQCLSGKTWIFKFRKSIYKAKIRLICFPFAGGSASFFHSWQALMPDEIELVAIELPGRASRIKEPLITQGYELLDELEKLELFYEPEPFAFFGHSMGAYIAFELSRRLKEKHKPQPFSLFLSARQAPNLDQKEKQLHDLPEKEFIRQIANLNGMPREVLDNAELMEIVSPVLRADCKLLETWCYVESEQLNLPITAMMGEDDPSTKESQIKSWAAFTSNSFNLVKFSGDHFFINTAKKAVVDEIVRTLKVL